MNVTFTGGTERERDLVHTAIRSLLNFDFDLWDIDVEFRWVADPSAEGHNDLAATTINALGDVLIEVRNDLDTYKGLPPTFYIESIAHELGHLIIGHMDAATLQVLADYLTTSVVSITTTNPSQAWEDRVKEGVVETFKDAFLSPTMRLYTNRTNRKWPLRLYPGFREIIRNFEREWSGNPLDPFIHTGEYETWVDDVMRFGNFGDTQVLNDPDPSGGLNQEVTGPPSGGFGPRYLANSDAFYYGHLRDELDEIVAFEAPNQEWFRGASIPGDTPYVPLQDPPDPPSSDPDYHAGSSRLFSASFSQFYEDSNFSHVYEKRWVMVLQGWYWWYTVGATTLPPEGYSVTGDVEVYWYRDNVQVHYEKVLDAPLPGATFPFIAGVLGDDLRMIGMIHEFEGLGYSPVYDDDPDAFEGQRIVANIQYIYDPNDPADSGSLASYDAFIHDRKPVYNAVHYEEILLPPGGGGQIQKQPPVPPALVAPTSVARGGVPTKHAVSGAQINP